MLILQLHALYRNKDQHRHIGEFHTNTSSIFIPDWNNNKVNLLNRKFYFENSLLNNKLLRKLIN